MTHYTGQCLCGACNFTIKGEPSAMYLCHCSRCRKESGTTHGATVFFRAAELSWEKGEENISSFALKNTRKKRNFCKLCGSPLPRQEEQNQVVLPAGSLDEPSLLEPTAHIFYASRASWEDKLSELAHFAELPH